jgi:hypothetical protein
LVSLPLCRTLLFACESAARAVMALCLICLPQTPVSFPFRTPFTKVGGCQLYHLHHPGPAGCVPNTDLADRRRFPPWDVPRKSKPRDRARPHCANRTGQRYGASTRSCRLQTNFAETARSARICRPGPRQASSRTRPTSPGKRSRRRLQRRGTALASVRSCRVRGLSSDVA